MDEQTVGIRELKSRLSEYLQRVREGQTVVITDRGQPVGRIVPAGQPLAERMETLIQAGLACWDGRKLERAEPIARVAEGGSVADLLLRDREASIPIDAPTAEDDPA